MGGTKLDDSPWTSGAERPVRRPPALSFRAVRVDRYTQPGAFAVEGGDGRILFRGILSAGSTGWNLSAVASHYRSTIDLYVTARQGESQAAEGIEDFDYEAVIEVPPGMYQLRLKHIYIFHGAGSAPSGLRVYERSVRVR